MNDGAFRSIIVSLAFLLIAIVGIGFGIVLTRNSLSVTDSSANSKITCYKCTSSETDSNQCEGFEYAGVVCPSGSSSVATACATAVGGKCPGSTFSSISDQTSSLTCYRCTSSATDGNACESFVTTGTACPSGSSSTATGCATAAGGSCSQVTTCYRCTSATNDNNTCEPFVVEGASCPTGSTTSPTACATSVGGQCPINPVACGEIDVNNDGKVDVEDLAGFQAVYGRFCSDSPYSATSTCGAKDYNDDGKINALDLNNFNAKYLLPNCTQ